MNTRPEAADTKSVKRCCAQLYESDLAKSLLGDSLHPGGLGLTERVGVLLDVTPQSRVLDVASGRGTSAFFLAERFGCEVVGIDYSVASVAGANDLAATKGLASGVRFECGDGERLRFPDGYFDAVLCECAFCTFPDKAAAAREFARVLRPGGRVGLSDLTRGPVLPKELDNLTAWIACIADAQAVEAYVEHLQGASLEVERVEPHDEALTEIVQRIRMKLLSAEVLAGLKKIMLDAVDFTSAKRMAQSALAAIQQGQLGYAVLIASKKCRS